MGILCAVSLKNRTDSPFEIAGAAFPEAVVDILDAIVVKTGAHWERVYQLLSPTERAALAPFLLDVATIQSSRRNDFAQLARLLEIAIANGMGATTLCAQGAELLSRIAVFGGWAD
jgi:hypothetical protein